MVREKGLSRERAGKKRMKKRQAKHLLGGAHASENVLSGNFLRETANNERNVCLNGAFVPRCFRRFFKTVFISVAHLSCSTSESVACDD